MYYRRKWLNYNHILPFFCLGVETAQNLFNDESPCPKVMYTNPNFRGELRSYFTLFCLGVDPAPNLFDDESPCPKGHAYQPKIQKRSFICEMLTTTSMITIAPLWAFTRAESCLIMSYFLFTLSPIPTKVFL